MKHIVKRTFDICLAVPALILFGPVMLVIAVLIWLETPGPVIYSQKRLGYRGRPFLLYKFRKFPVNWTDGGSGVTTAHDPRLTRVGAMLERLKFDELPQLWNILKGEMAFVGPRPESLRFAELFDRGYERVLDFVPGIFGPNQVAFRNESYLYPPDEDPEAFYARVLFPKKAANDLKYFSRSTLFKDLGYILQGVWVSLFGSVPWKMFFKGHGRRIFLDLICISVAWTLAYLTRYPELQSLHIQQSYKLGLVLLPASLIAGFLLFGVYNHPPKYFSLSDAGRLLRVSGLTWILVFLLLLGLERSLSLYLFPIFFVILVVLLITSRMVARLRWEKRENELQKQTHTVAVYGTGRGGRALVSWFTNGALKGFIDDTPEHKGKRIKGYPVLGHGSEIPTIHEVHQFDELWMTFVPDKAKRRQIETICREKGIKLVVFPELEPFSRFVSKDKMS
ncbi:MAG: sugar transferase [Desulfohalobiaceae bacterium]|nr:sugar transferase [Desulfohalobiaceae bacterium]